MQAERQTFTDTLCLSVCLSVCLSACLYVCQYLSLLCRTTLQFSGRATENLYVANGERKPDASSPPATSTLEVDSQGASASALAGPEAASAARSAPPVAAAEGWPAPKTERLDDAEE